jgi:hypothetical protein
MDEGKKQLFAALIKAQSEFKTVHKNGYNPHFKSKYATLSDCWDAVKEALFNNQICIIQKPTYENSIFCIETFLIHASGEFERGVYPILGHGNNPQSAGSAVSYARRYSLKAMLNLTDGEGEDDGNAASGKPDGNKKERGAGDKRKASVEPEPMPQEEYAGFFNSVLQLGVSQAELDKELSRHKVVTRDVAKNIYKNFERVTKKKPGNPAPDPKANKVVTQAQIARLFAICGKHGWDDDHIHDFIGKEFGITSTKELTMQQYDSLVAEVEKK